MALPRKSASVTVAPVWSTRVKGPPIFASPLMLKTSDGSYFDVLPPISFEDEFEQIRQGIEEKQLEFLYTYQVATSVNLLKVLRENPVGLHFSGHGFKNAEVIYEGDKKAWIKNKNNQYS